MAHNIVLQAYERSLQARAHYLPYNVPLREKPKIIRKVLEMIEHLEKLCAEFSAIVHNKEDEKCCKNEKAVSSNKGKSNKTSMEKSTKYIPPPKRKKSKKEENCWKCGDKYFAGHGCAFYTENTLATNSEKNCDLLPTKKIIHPTHSDNEKAVSLPKENHRSSHALSDGSVDKQGLLNNKDQRQADSSSSEGGTVPEIQDLKRTDYMSADSSAVQMSSTKKIIRGNAVQWSKRMNCNPENYSYEHKIISSSILKENYKEQTLAAASFAGDQKYVSERKIDTVLTTLPDIASLEAAGNNRKVDDCLKKGDEKNWQSHLAAMNPRIAIECPYNPLQSRSKMAELLFETYGIPYLAFGVDVAFSVAF